MPQPTLALAVQGQMLWAWAAQPLVRGIVRTNLGEQQSEVRFSPAAEEPWSQAYLRDGVSKASARLELDPALQID